MRYLPLICLTLVHTLVDTCAVLVAPLWPSVQNRYGLGVAALSLAFIVQQLPTSISQAICGYMRDRRPAPWMIWIGAAGAAIFLPLLGVAPGTGVLFAVLMAGGIGVGAFHPEAAVAAGNMLPEHRTRALSLFMFGGSVGLAIGPTLSGLVVSRFGLAGLPYLVLPILALVLALSWTGGFLQLPGKSATRVPSHATSSFDGKPVLALLLLMACSLRIVPNMAMDKVLAFVMERRGYGPSTIGLTQTLFLASASAGMFAMVFRFRHGWERPSMIWCPLAGIPLLAILGWEACPRPLFLALLVPSGLILWGTTPAMVSYAQQLFPRSSGLASAITLGISWGLAGLVQAPVTAYFQSTGVPQHAFFALIPCLIVGAWAAWMLPATHQPAAATAPADGVVPTAADVALRPELIDA